MIAGNFSKGILLLLTLFLSFITKAQLTANFSASPQSGCAPLVVRFNDLSTGGATSWQWDLGNGTISYLQNPSGIYFSPGKYTVKLVIKNINNADSMIKTNFIEVYSNPTADFSVNSTTGCYPLDVEFKDKSAPSSGTLSSWLWDFGDGVTSTSTNPRHTYTSARNFSVTLQVKNSNGCVAISTKPSLIQINTGVLADFTNDNPHSCTAPVTINFQDQSTGTGTVQYLWDFGDNTTSTLINPSHTYTTNGTYNVKLMLMNNSGCKDTSVKLNNITIGTVNAGISVPDNICQDMPALVNNTSSPTPASVLWNFGDGSISTQFNPAKTYTSTGIFNLKMVANFGACTDSVSKQVIVLPSPNANFTADNTATCKAPFSVNFTSQGLGIVSYMWDFGDNTTSTSANPTHIYNSNDSFTVKLIVTNGNGCTDTIVKKNYIRINKIKTTLNLPDSGCVPFTKNFSLKTNPVVSVASYLWDFGDGNTSSNATPSHTFTTEGAYDISAIIITAGGCTDTARVVRAIVASNKPVINFGASPLNTCAKTSISFNDLTPGATKWLWKFGDNSASTLKNPSHQYVDTGYFDVQLTVWKSGCPDSVKFVKYVHTTPAVAKFNIAIDCKKPFDRAFTDKSIGADEWHWDFGDGGTSLLQNPSHTYANTGQYTVTLRVVNNTSGCDFTTTKIVQIINAKAAFTSVDTTICRGGKVTFTSNLSLSQISTFNWNFGDGSPATNINTNTVVYTYKKTGTFNVRLIITDINGCKDTLTRVNYININGPTAKFAAIVPSVCLNNTVTFMDSTVTDGTHPLQKWVWDYGDGAKETLTTPPFAHFYTQTGSYIVKLNVTDSKGCVDSFKLVNPIIVTKPVANFSTIDTFSCPDKQVKLINQSAGVNLTYKWNFGDNTSDTAKNPLHGYAADGTYTVKLNVTDKYGCADSVTKQQFISINTPLSYFSMSDSVSNCPPLIINFTDSSTNAVNRKWDFGDSTFSKETNPIHFYNYPGTYFVKLTVTSYGGCTSVFQRRVIIKGPEGSFTYNPVTGCNPVTVNFTASTNNRNTVLWDFNDGNTLGTPTLTASNIYLHAGSYIPKMILIDPAGCKVPFPGKDTITVSGINANFSFSKKLLCDSGIISFKDSSVAIHDIVTNYQWNFGDGGSSTSKNPSHQFTTTGIYYPRLIAISQLGCTDTITSAVPARIVASPKINIISSGSGCTPLTVTFSSQMLLPDTSAINWQWNLANGNVSAAANPAVQNYTTGVYNVSLSGTNSSGCKSTVIKNTEAYPIPVVNAGTDTILCKGSGISLNATGAATYTWSPSTALSCINCPNPATTTPNNISYFVTGTSIHGCIAKDTIAVKVKTKFIFSHSPSDSVCKGSTKKMTASGGYTYQWTPTGSLDNATISSPTAQPDTTTTYRVVATDDRGCFKDTGYIAIRVNPIPSVEAGTDKTINVGKTIDLVPIVSADVVDVNWQPTTGIFRNSYPGVTVKPKENTEYTVEVKNKGKCLAKDRVTVYVICNGSNIFIPNTFSPNGDGSNDIFYPRGTGVFKIKNLRIFNRWGEVVFDRSSFDANNPSNGWDGTNRGTSLNADVFVYTLEVICDNGSILTYNGNIALIR